jgi:hypothetical protein
MAVHGASAFALTPPPAHCGDAHAHTAHAAPGAAIERADALHRAPLYAIADNGAPAPSRGARKGLHAGAVRVERTGDAGGEGERELGENESANGPHDEWCAARAYRGRRRTSRVQHGSCEGVHRRVGRTSDAGRGLGVDDS